MCKTDREIIADYLKRQERLEEQNRALADLIVQANDVADAYREVSNMLKAENKQQAEEIERLEAENQRLRGELEYRGANVKKKIGY